MADTVLEEEGATKAKPDGSGIDPRFQPAQGIPYRRFFRKLHRTLDPAWYLEVGTKRGRTLELARCASVAVDPRFQVASNVMNKKPALHMFHMTSDEFFERGELDKLGIVIDFAFLDGMHLVEFLLRDVINTEPYMAEEGLMLLHDTRPPNAVSAGREQCTGAWTGDVWKLLPILRDYRPDLKIRHIDCQPSGLTLIEGPWGGSTALSDSYDEIEARYVPMTLEEYGVERFLSDFPLVAPEDIVQEIEDRKS